VTISFVVEIQFLELGPDIYNGKRDCEREKGIGKLRALLRVRN